MRLKKEYIVNNVDGEHMTVTAGNTNEFNGIIRSNEVAGFIINCLAEEISQDEIVKKLFDEYNAPVERIAEDVGKIIDKLRNIGAIDE